MKRYLRPLMQVGPARPDGDAMSFGWCWFTHVEVLARGAEAQVVPVSALSDDERAQFCAGAARPQLMGIVNTTPDSFSDGGQHEDLERAVGHGLSLVEAGADIIDVGGESTRPGAATVPEAEEIARTAPVIAGLRARGTSALISIDTRKAVVADAAIEAGADIVNDVSGFSYDAALAPLCVSRGTPVCVMHAQGEPQTMQDAPHYDNVLLDVYDVLEARIDMLVKLGIPRADITADPGIGFGQTQEHILAILNRISLFHGLGVPILLGASRKRFIGAIGNQPEPAARSPGSVAVALAAVAQGVQIIRAHDVADHAQAIALWRAAVAHP